MMLNPVLAKELKDRVRTWRSPMLITLYIAFMSLIGGFFFYTQTRFNAGGPQMLRLGMEIFQMLAFLQLLLIAFLTPAMTGGIISGERERQTFSLLLVTRLSPLGIATGKLLSATGYILLLIILSMPLYSFVFLFGGVSLLDLLKTMGVYLATTLTLGSVALYCSTAFRRTTVAIVAAYALTFVVLAGTIFVTVMYQQLSFNGIGQPPAPPLVLYLNPLIALGSLLPMGGQFMPFINTGGNPIVTPLPIWQLNLLWDAVIMLITLGATVWLIHPLRVGKKRSE
jgi:ABC-2 type transport system permease protein